MIHVICKSLLYLLYTYTKRRTNDGNVNKYSNLRKKNKINPLPTVPATLFVLQDKRYDRINAR